MDDENVKASEAADFAYAKWYNQLPDEKKATFFKNAHKMVVDKMTYDVKKENPFSNHADVMMQFIELTQKDAYSPEIFAFIQKTMAEKSEKEWQERFKTGAIGFCPPKYKMLIKNTFLDFKLLTISDLYI
jgi:hypothetical protein